MLVALKITRADARAASREIRMHELIERSDIESRAKQHVVTLLDSFVHSGSNGEHQCLVFPPMGESTNSLFERQPTSDVNEDAARYSNAKTVIKHLLLGLHCLHSIGIAHGDLNPGNLLFSLRGLTAEDVPQLLQQPTPDNISSPVKRKDGKPDLWAPEHLCADRPITELVASSASADVRLSDLGSAFLIADPPAKTVTPAALRAPELVLEMPFDHRIDIWSFGCLAFAFITTASLFDIADYSFIPKEQTDDDHLLQMVDVLGQIPPHMIKKWERHSRYFGPNLEVIRTDVGPSEACEYPIYVGPTMEDKFEENRPKCIDSEEASKVLSLLRRILQYEPDQRPSTAEILEDEWIKSIP